MKKAVRLFITGSVQSLFFRTFVKQQADLYNVKGFVRKREDGRLEIFLEGERQRVDSVKEICKKGPKHSVIRLVEETEEKVQGFPDFKIFNF